uniref:General transcription factor TFIIB n=1 Tax=Chlamydomonas leiostraca TaxID=1034604 RepID=A0A7S0RRQ4_9CHLO|mmetsp:Transcript_2992/g.7385  ORF Transcript_2992/g.7385 Transcript_2992/m.7385 type:complete len:344 (+) Transcript_2992:122-1153(+)
MATQERKCPDCNGIHFVEDHANGDIVCKGCGLVVEAHIIDERSEWRTFSDKDKESADPNRVGGPTNQLLEGGGLSTVIGKGRDGDANYMLNRLHTRSNNPDRALVAAFKTLGDMCERLSLVNTAIKDAACDLYKRAMESGRLRGRGMMSICAACLYLACRQNNTPRSFKEITEIMPPNVAKKDIGRCFKEVVQLMKDTAAAGTGGALAAANMAALAPTAQHPADYMRRFCSELKLKDLHQSVLRACNEMALKAKPKEAGGGVKPWDGRSPISIAAAILYMVTTMMCVGKDAVSMQDVHLVTNVAEATIRTAYRDLYGDLKNLLPQGLGTPEQIARLPVPRFLD